ncbi:hypothetical protein V8C42DRAFT_319260 [Trichoderma barbatum]
MPVPRSSGMYVQGTSAPRAQARVQRLYFVRVNLIRLRPLVLSESFLFSRSIITSNSRHRCRVQPSPLCHALV